MIRVVLADDHRVLRDGLRLLLEAGGAIAVVGEAGNGAQTLAQVRRGECDVLVLDLSMPGRSGLELLKQIKAERPRLPVLVLTMHAEQQYAVRAIRAGAAGYLTKDVPAQQVIEAVVRLARGGAWISPAVARRLALETRPAPAGPPHEALSDREFQVFQWLVAGLTVSAIARRLHLSVKTVSTHKTHVLAKLGCGSVVELVRHALAHGLVPEEVAVRD